MMKRVREFSPETIAAVTALSALIAAGRRRQGWTASELAARLGVDPSTVTRIERGEPSVGVGLMFDAAILCGVQLFNADAADLPARERRAQAELALLPASVRPVEQEISDDF